MNQRTNTNIETEREPLTDGGIEAPGDDAPDQFIANGTSQESIDDVDEEIADAGAAGQAGGGAAAIGGLGGGIPDLTDMRSNPR